MDLTFAAISRAALEHNFRAFRRRLGTDTALCAVVKANAYGHGLLPCARIFEALRADFLGVNALDEAEVLRAAGIKTPILVLGYIPLPDLAKAVRLQTDMTVYNSETLRALGRLGRPARLHLKIETGTHRQGVYPEDIPAIARMLRQFPQLQLAGVSTHFADLEDRVDHRYAHGQLRQFSRAIELLKKEGFAPRFRHAANSAATLLLPKAFFNMARVGISLYGLWPSEKIELLAKRRGVPVTLRPALAWKTRIAQVKPVKKGAKIGYGCTYQMPRDGKIAVIPVGYYEGYARITRDAHVLVRGKNAPVIGRICMNMLMADVTDVPGARAEDEAVLLGRQGRERIAAEDLARWSGTINYEAVTRIGGHIPRVIVD